MHVQPMNAPASVVAGGSRPATAFDLMTAPVVVVAPEASVSEVARLLLEKHVGAVPVVEGNGTLIGMASEGDLLGRSREERLSGQEWWLAMLAGHHGTPGLPDDAALRRPVREVMHAPVVTIAADAPVPSIAETMRAQHVKRLPVMVDGRMVGIVTRADLLRAVEAMPSLPNPGHAPEGVIGLILGLLLGSGPHAGGAAAPRSDAAAPAPAPAAPPPATAEAFRHLVERCVAGERDEKAAAATSAALERQREVRLLLQTHLDAATWSALLDRARVAAAHGAKEFELLRFPADLCSDGGRRVDVAEAGWPDTLRGEPADLYARWERELKPVGFGLSARILTWPGGKPGDVGLCLVWGE